MSADVPAPGPLEELSQTHRWEDVSAVLDRAEEGAMEARLEAHERAVNPDGLCLRDLLTAACGDAPDEGMARYVLSARARGYLEEGELKVPELRRYLHHAARGILPASVVDRTLDQALLKRRWPEAGTSLERAADPERRRRSLEEALRRRRAVGLRLGIRPLDALINGGFGAGPGEALHIVGAEGSLKTSLLLNALCGCVARGLRVLFLSLDMAPERIEERLLGRLMGCGPEEARRLIREDAPRYRRALEARRAEDGRFLIMGGPMGIEGAKAAALAADADVVAVDYVTALEGFRSELDAARAVAREFRDLTRGWGMTLALLSQMSLASFRDQAQGGTGTHAMGGGSLAQFVDYEVELFKDGGNGADQSSRLIATLRKNRSGEAGRSFEVFPDFPSLNFSPEATPVELARPRRALFRPSGVI